MLPLKTHLVLREGVNNVCQHLALGSMNILTVPTAIYCLCMLCVDCFKLCECLALLPVILHLKVCSHLLSAPLQHVFVLLQLIQRVSSLQPEA